MKNYLFLFAFIFSINTSLFAQKTNLLLLDNIETRVDKLKPKLDLNSSECFRLTDILYNSVSDIANLDLFAVDLESRYMNIINLRNKNIKATLGENKYKIFILLETIEKESIQEDYQELVQISGTKQQINENIIEYRLKYVLPRLSQVNQNFISSLSVDNIIKLREIRLMYYAFSKDLTGESKALFSNYLGTNKTKDLMKLINLFKQKLEVNGAELERLRARWIKDQEQIVMNNLIEENLSESQKSQIVNGMFKMKQELFLLHVLMIVPNDKTLYLQNLETVIHQQHNFQQIIK